MVVGAAPALVSPVLVKVGSEDVISCAVAHWSVAFATPNVVVVEGNKRICRCERQNPCMMSRGYSSCKRRCCSCIVVMVRMYIFSANQKKKKKNEERTMIVIAKDANREHQPKNEHGAIHHDHHRSYMLMRTNSRSVSCCFLIRE